MCGIAGLLSVRPTNLAAIDEMVAAQLHRGPDGSAVALLQGGSVHSATEARYLESSIGNVALGHNRLAIIDLSDAALQPMRSADSACWIVFNGEIYNYRELKCDLAALGRHFQTTSDTEVILAAYDEWGVDCFKRFNGMWVIALLDLHRRRLVLSRDRFGEKPLHLAVDDDRLLFASEIKAILAIRRKSPQLNSLAAALYLRHGIVNSSDDTFFDGVCAFPPAHYAEIRLDRPLECVPVRFWSPPPQSELGTADLSTAEIDGAFLNLFRSSIGLRMRSDVPVGSCLSGGLDSSAIVCEASPMRPSADPMDTFTAGFEDRRLDERRYADAVNAKAATRGHVTVPTVERMIEDWPALVRAQDEPFTTPSIYAQYCVMRLSRENGVKVLLDGQGGDEAMAGYRKYAMFHLQRLFASRRFGEFGAFALGLALNGDRGLLRLWEGVRYLPRMLRGRAEGLTAAVAAPFRESWNAAVDWRREAGGGVEDRQVDDLVRYSLPSLLRYEDRNAMAFGIETRVPFLDHRLIEFFLRLPAGDKLSHGRTKSVLRRGLRGSVPDMVLDRREKMGFGPPQQSWLRGAFGAEMRKAFRSEDFRLRRIVDPYRAERLLDAQGFWAPAHLNAAFRVHCLDSWARTFGVETGRS